jgi:hypothetical protein
LVALIRKEGMITVRNKVLVNKVVRNKAVINRVVIDDGRGSKPVV